MVDEPGIERIHANSERDDERATAREPPTPSHLAAWTRGPHFADRGPDGLAAEGKAGRISEARVRTKGCGSHFEEELRRPLRVLGSRTRPLRRI